MLKLMQSITELTNFIMLGPKPRAGLLIHTTELRNGGSLKVYLTGWHQSKYKFVYCNGERHKSKCTNRLLRDRLPMAELKTGIHDAMLTDFTGTTINFFK